MQSINAGFQSLRNLLPHREGEKLSKAAILQSTADYVYQLEREKARLLEQNCQLARRLVPSPQHNPDSDESCSGSPLPKRKKRETVDSIDEGIGSSSPSRSELCADESKREIMDLRLQLDQERTLRLLLEEQIRNLESRLYLTRDESDSAEQIRLHYHSATEENVKCLSAMNLGHESGLGSPQSPLSSQDIESSHEMSLRGSSPELSSSEIPEDLSGKSNSVLPLVEGLLISDVGNISGLNHPASPILSSLTVETFTSKQTFQVSTSRQNLETIVEAIRHVEGDHMFRDDPAPRIRNTNQDIENSNSLVYEQNYPEHTNSALSLTTRDISFQHQIIRNAPVTQSRPGVIVSNLP